MAKVDVPLRMARMGRVGGMFTRRSCLASAMGASLGGGLLSACGGGGSAVVEGPNAVNGGGSVGGGSGGGSAGAASSTWYLWRRQAGEQRFYRIANRAKAQAEVVHPGTYVIQSEPLAYNVANLVPAKQGRHFVIYGWSYRGDLNAAFAVHQLNANGQAQLTHTIRGVPGQAEFASLSHDGRYLAVAVSDGQQAYEYLPLILVYDLNALGPESVNPPHILAIDSRNPSDPVRVRSCFWTPKNQLLAVQTDGSIAPCTLTGVMYGVGSLPKRFGDYEINFATDLSPDGQYLVGSMTGPTTGVDLYNFEYWVCNLSGADLRQATAIKLARSGTWAPDGRIFGHRSSPDSSSPIVPGMRGYDYSFLASGESSMLTDAAAQNLALNLSAGFPNTETGGVTAVLTL